MNEPFDKQKALEQLGGSEEMLKEVAQTFLEECPQLMQQIDTAIEEENAEELRRAAHTVKGSVDVFSAEPTRAAAARLEEIGKEGNFSEAPAAADELKQEIERLKPALQEWAG